MRRPPLSSRLAGAFMDLVRWGEPWDVEDDDDLLEAAPLVERALRPA